MHDSFPVRGYLPADAESKATVVDINADQDALRELAIKKQNLLKELKNYGENDRVGTNSAVRLVIMLD